MLRNSYHPVVPALRGCLRPSSVCGMDGGRDGQHGARAAHARAPQRDPRLPRVVSGTLRRQNVYRRSRHAPLSGHVLVHRHPEKRQGHAEILRSAAATARLGARRVCPPTKRETRPTDDGEVSLSETGRHSESLQQIPLLRRRNPLRRHHPPREAHALRHGTDGGNRQAPRRLVSHHDLGS